MAELFEEQYLLPYMQASCPLFHLFPHPSPTSLGVLHCC